MSDNTCNTCGKKAVVKEQDVFYACAECWVKRNAPKKEKRK